MNYIDLKYVDEQCRVTFEAENNLDFRLGTEPLLYTRLAIEGDLAAISRVGERHYELRLYRQRSPEYVALLPYVIHMGGGRGKVYGFMSNLDFATVLGIPRIGKTHALTL